MIHYSHKSIPDAPENGFNFYKKWVFMSRVVFLDPKLTPHVHFSNSQAEENFFIFKICATSRWEKSSTNPLDWSILLKFGQNISLGIKTKSRQVWASESKEVSDWQLWIWSYMPLSPPPLPGLIGLKCSFSWEGEEKSNPSWKIWKFWLFY